MCCLRHMLEITWQDKVTNEVVREKAGIPSLYTLLKQRRMQWLGHVAQKQDGCISKALLCGELATGKDQQDDPNYASRTYASETSRHLDSWEVTATYRDAWRHTVKLGLSHYEETQQIKAEEKRLSKKTVCPGSRPTTAFTCSKCGRDCHSWIGLHSHNRQITMGTNL